MKSTKKAVTEKSIKTRIPKGLPGAGRFGTANLIADLIFARDTLAAEMKERERLQKQREAKDRKNAASRETRAKQRAARATTMATPSDSVSNAQIQKKLKKWGSRSTSRLRAKTAYHWHAIIVVSGGSEALGKIAVLAHSERTKFQPVGEHSGVPEADKRFDAVFTPYLGAMTPADAQSMALGIAEDIAAQYRETGANVELRGVFYNRERFE